MTRNSSRILLVLALILAAPVAACNDPTAPAPSQVTASPRRGADDPAVHNQNDDRGRGQREPEPGDNRRGRGADDPIGHH